jgi:hypothetical protein
LKEIIERDGWGRYGGRGLISERIFGILNFGNNFIGDVVAVGIDQDGDVVAVILDKFHKNHLNSLLWAGSGVLPGAPTIGMAGGPAKGK